MKLIKQESMRSRRLIPWLFIVVTSLAGLALFMTADSAAQERRGLWQERSEIGTPIVPPGFTPLPSLAGLVKELKPAVVNIFTTQVVKPRKGFGRSPRFRDPLFEQFFGGSKQFEHFFKGPRGEYKRNSLGSGFIIAEDGYIITNHHVVANASEIKVKLADDRSLQAKIIGSDKKTDVALLKIDAKGKLPIVFLGDSDKLLVGDWVVAIGSPFGLGHTVTAGIVSGKDREIGHGPYDDFLQTDASINVGNSGGPLFDTAGNVVGINTAIIAGGSGIGFAVPINMAKELLPQLRRKGKVTRGWLGVGIQNLTAELAENFGVKPKEGVLVSQVFASGPAEKAGLKAGDIILSINGKKVQVVRELTHKVATLAPGQKAKVVVLRDKQRKTLSVELGEREQGESIAMGRQSAAPPKEADLGLGLAPLTPAKARRLGAAEDLRGLVVMEIDPKSPAAGMIRAGDIILEVNRIRVATLKEFRRAAVRGKKKSVLLKIQRETSQVYLVIDR
ncbi:MAG: DegQ family serine endoprotease [Deltaproteobacteria bacterium]|nr:DegQ family serine endoprotease [Deltaproteobacteria bacterium]